ncbi:MAG: methyltransferase domain-containing protein [Thermoplasmatota archaeon]
MGVEGSMGGRARGGVRMPPRLLFELSGEHPTLPVAEAEALGSTVPDGARRIAWEPGVLVLEAPRASSYPFNRLAYTHAVHSHLFSCPPDHLKRRLASVLEGDGAELPVASTAAVRVGVARGAPVGSRPIGLERALGAVLAARYTIRLNRPGLSLRVLISKRAHVGVTLWEQPKKPLEARRAQHRPFFSPVSLPPKLARAMVNLTAVPSGSTVLDPFCGTGGILIEAGEMGVGVVGGDIDPRMVEGCGRNLAHYGVAGFELHKADVGELPRLLKGRTVDGVVTDPPYGRASGTKGEGVRAVSSRLFRMAAELLEPGRRLVLSLPDPSLAHPGESFRLLLEATMRVHRSLTRHVMVYEKV